MTPTFLVAKPRPRRHHPRVRRIALAAVVAVLATATPAAAGDADPDPLSILPGRGFTETVGLGNDVVTVWICDTQAPKDTSFSLQDIVDWGNDEVAPFFALISGGRYSVTFVAGGEFSVPRSGTAADQPCLAGAIQRTTTANTMVMTRAVPGGGLGTGGTLFAEGSSVSGATLLDQSRDTGRGFLVRGGSYGLPMTVAHEIGHTLWWPHSGSAVDDSTAEYDNQVDLMSGGGYDPSTMWTNGCLFGPVEKGACEIVHTLAINRYASGWIDADEVVPVARDGVSVELVGPEAGAGDALALVPTADPLVYLTVEAKPATGYDSVMPVSGVVVHEVDLTFECDDGPPFCVGTSRRQQPAVSAVDTDAHVIEVGESLTVAGVEIAVTGATTDGFTVEFRGDPAGCSMGPNPFTDLSETSFAFDNVGCIRILGITTGTTASTYSPAQSVTREQMAAFLGRLWRALGNACASPTTPFTDVAATSFAFHDVACIWDLGVTTGTTGTTYSPAQSVTREQMAAFLGRLWRALGNTCSTAPTTFTDIDGSFAEADVACIFHLGITTGTTSATYSPAEFVTREQMAAFIARFWEAAT